MKTFACTFRPDDLEFIAHLDHQVVKLNEPNFSEVLITVDSFVAEFKMIGDMASADEWDIEISDVIFVKSEEVRDENYEQLIDHIHAMCTNHAQENIETVWKSLGWKGHNHA